MMNYIDSEVVVHVRPEADGWRVRSNKAKETSHHRKAVAALRAKQLAGSGAENGRVIFYRADGTVEVERRFERLNA
jgi:hypothetical protein